MQQFSINLINPQRKSEGVVKKVRKVPILSTVHDLKEHVCSCLKASCDDVSLFELGYYEPRHGTKGKKRWLMDDDDLEEMKKLYKKKKEVLLWCYDPSIQQVSRKRQLVDSDPGPSAPKTKSRSRFVNAYEKKMSKVEEVYGTLLEKHGKRFRPEQLRAWANMVQMQKHTSLEEPPSGRFFKTQSERKGGEEESTTRSAPDPTALSSAKRVTLRTQCIEQLERWHQLMEKGGISKEQYDELQANILSEIKKY